MKNAMKKLTSLLLVAVLLVGAIPFGAFAAEFNPTAFLGTSSEAAATAAEPAPASLDTNNEAAADAPAAQSSTGTEKTISYVVDYPDQNDLSGTTRVKTGDSWTTVLKYITTVSEKYSVTPSFSTVEDSTESVTFTCTVKTFNFTVKINGFNESTKQGVAYGTVLKLDESLLSEFGLSLATGYEIDTFSVSGDTYTVTNTDTITVYPKLAGTAGSNSGNNSGSTASYVDVILVNDNRTSGFASNEYHHCVLVNGKISPADRDAIAAKMPAGTVAWKRGDNGKQSNSLLNFDFSDLKAPINIFPVIGNVTNGSTSNSGVSNSNTNTSAGKVEFRYNDGRKYVATLTADGKLAAEDVNNATAGATVEGYTFNGWLINGSGSVTQPDQLIRMDFSNGNYMLPNYTKKAANTTINSAKNQNDIFLNIFVNKDFQHCKTIKLNDHWVISDDKITKDEILQYVVTDYYKASNGNLGLQADMLYYSVGSFMYNWLTDNGTTVIDDITTKRSQGTVTVNIMVTNAVAKNGSAADTSNPKTGDDIYTAMTVMGLSAASLAAVMFFYNKKRYTV